MVRSSCRRAVRPGGYRPRPRIIWRAAWRIRTGAVVLLVAGWLALHWLAPDPSVRRTWLSLVALPLGYGHLLGASLSSRVRRGSGLDRLLSGLCSATVLCTFTWAMHGAARVPMLAVLMAVAVWHILENDLAMGRGGTGGRLPPLPRHARPHAIALGGTLLLVVVAVAVFGASPWLAVGSASPPLAVLEEMGAALLLYHAITWVLFVLECARHLPRLAARVRRRRLLWVHALPVSAIAATWHWLPDLHVLLTSPALYLFWSGAHAIQTARARGLEPA